MKLLTVVIITLLIMIAAAQTVAVELPFFMFFPTNTHTEPVPPEGATWQGVAVTWQGGDVTW